MHYRLLPNRYFLAILAPNSVFTPCPHDQSPRTVSSTDLTDSFHDGLHEQSSRTSTANNQREQSLRTVNANNRYEHLFRQAFYASFRMGECSTRSPKLEWSTTSVDDFIGLNLIEIRDREARLAVSKWFCNLVKHIQDDQAKFCDKKTFMDNSFKRQNFKRMLAKLFAGEQWEQKILRGLSLGRRISCCIALVPRQLQEIYDHGLSDFFATKLNQILPEWAIPEWIERRIKSIASESHKGSEFALGFLAGLFLITFEYLGNKY